MKWPNHKDIRKFRKDVALCSSQILYGTMLAVDPASINMGWALFHQGKCVASGKYNASSTIAPHKRLQILAECISEHMGIEVLAVEKMFRFNASLIWSVGATIVAAKPKDFVEVPVKAWKLIAEEDPSYRKDDEYDAIMIGYATVEMAKEFMKEFE